MGDFLIGGQTTGNTHF